MTKIEAQGTSRGMDWACLIMDGGWRCGYVRIPEGHPLHGVSYNAPAPGVTWDDLKNEAIGKRGVLEVFCSSLDEPPRLGVLFNVHGSLTFSDDLAHIGLPGWWLGFDCNHAGDRADPELASDGSKLYAGWSFQREGEIRSREYVIFECVQLIEQIVTRYGEPATQAVQESA